VTDQTTGRYVTPLGARADFVRTFGPTEMRYMGDSDLLMVHRYVAVHDTATGRRVAGFLRRLGPREECHREPRTEDRPTVPRSPVRHAVLETFPGVYVQAWVDLHEQVTTFGCSTCVAQMFHANRGGPAHDPQPTCRMGGLRPHCTCRGCW
jgi:hypothetical protein